MSLDDSEEGPVAPLYAFIASSSCCIRTAGLGYAPVASLEYSCLSFKNTSKLLVRPLVPSSLRPGNSEVIMDAKFWKVLSPPQATQYSILRVKPVPFCDKIVALLISDGTKGKGIL